VNTVHHPLSALSAAVRNDDTSSPIVGTSHRIATTASRAVAGARVNAATSRDERGVPRAAAVSDVAVVAALMTGPPGSA
jgi:hypothetical protein